MYNVNDVAASTINMRVHTVVMNAHANVNPSQSYHIKLVLGVYNDSSYESAVFIESGSFNSSLDLGEDISICSDKKIVLHTKKINSSKYSVI